MGISNLTLIEELNAVTKRFLAALTTVTTAAVIAFLYFNHDKGFDAYSRGDYEAAMKYWKPMAEDGNSKAQFNIGELFANGKGVQKNEVEAAKWYRLSAEQGDASAQVNLGSLYLTGNALRKDVKEAIKWYKLAAEQGSVNAQTMLGLAYFDEEIQDYEKAAKWLLLAANNGRSYAQYRLGLMYKSGVGVERDARKAVEWLRLAVDQDETKAFYGLGLHYATGMGTETNQAEAARLFRRGADKGDADSQNALGILFSNAGPTQDFTEAAKWLGMAANQGHPEAQFALAGQYMMGEGVTFSPDKAIHYYNLSAAQGNVNSQLMLGNIHSNGVKKDLTLSIKWLQLAANQGNKDAKIQLAKLEATKMESTKNTNEAVDDINDSSQNLYSLDSDPIIKAYAGGLKYILHGMPQRMRLDENQKVFFLRCISIENLEGLQILEEYADNLLPLGNGQFAAQFEFDVTACFKRMGIDY